MIYLKFKIVDMIAVRFPNDWIEYTEVSQKKIITSINLYCLHSWQYFVSSYCWRTTHRLVQILLNQILIEELRDFKEIVKIRAVLIFLISANSKNE